MRGASLFAPNRYVRLERIMPEERRCLACGGLLQTNAEGNCPACLLRLCIDGSPPESSTNAPPTPTRYFGDYEILGVIARGGMGIVYKARHLSLNRLVALKMIASGALASEGEVKRLRIEAEAAATLDHPNIVPIYEVGEHEGQHFFSMKLFDGGSLADALSRRPDSKNAAPTPATNILEKFPEFNQSAAAELIATVARAVHHAHQRGILHRDLKPSNILLDIEGRPHIADFGLAKLTSRDIGLTRSESVLGTPAYMSPEQAEGRARDLTTASDVYALGAILYEVLAGQVPFPADTPLEVMRRIVNEEPSTLIRLGRMVDRDLETICLQCLNKNIARRYSSAQELADDLERWLRHEPIQARPTSWRERAIKWTRRRPMVAGMAALAILATLALFTVVLVYNIRLQNRTAYAQDQERLARSERDRAESAVQRLALETAEGLFASDDVAGGLATLAQTVRSNPTNTLAAQRLVCALTQRDFALPLIPHLKHNGPLTAARFSPDGRRILTASTDGSACIWDASNGAKLLTLVTGQGRINDAAFDATGAWAATAAADGIARVWNAETGAAVSPPLLHEAPVNSVEFSPITNYLVTASDDHTARIWQFPLGRSPVASFRHDAAVRQAQFSRDGQRLLTSSPDFSARLWDVQTGQPVTPSLRMREDVTCAALSPDGTRIVTGSKDDYATLWNVPSGRVFQSGRRHDSDVMDCVFSPDGQQLATASLDQRARVWSLSNAAALPLVFEHGRPVLMVRFNLNGQRLATASADNTARVWDAKSGQPVTQPLQHRAPVTGVEFSGDGSKLLTRSEDGTAQLWDIHTSRSRGAPWQFEKRVSAVEFSQDDSTLLTASWQGLAHVWDSGSFTPIADPFRQPSEIIAAKFHPDGKRIVAATADGTVRVWDIMEKRVVGEPARHSNANVSMIALTRNGQRFVTTATDRCGWPFASRLRRLRAP